MFVVCFGCCTLVYWMFCRLSRWFFLLGLSFVCVLLLFCCLSCDGLLSLVLLCLLFVLHLLISFVYLLLVCCFFVLCLLDVCRVGVPVWVILLA